MKRCPLNPGRSRLVVMMAAAGTAAMVFHARPPGAGAADSALPPAAGPETVPLSARVAFITGKSPASRTAAPAERLVALRRLSPALPASDASALLAFATAPAPDGFPLSLWHALVNDTLDLLLRLPAPPPGLSHGLLRMTEHSDPALADYALQKLDKLVRLPLPPAVRQEAAGALARAAASHGAPFQGTALLTWGRLAETFPDDFGQPAFRKAVISCLQSPEASPAAQTAALNAGAAAGFPETAASARTLLASPGAGISLRISALHALGTTGSSGDIPLITQYLSVLGCEAAAAAALRKL